MFYTFYTAFGAEIVARQLLASPAMSWLMPCARDPSRLGPAGSLEMLRWLEFEQFETKLI